MKGKVLFEAEAAVEAVYDEKTGKLRVHRAKVDLVPNRVKGVKPSRKVYITISEWKQPK